MPAIEWRHNFERLLLPVALMPGYHSDNPSESIRTEGLLDTGATGTGIRRDVADRLRLRLKGQRRVYTANGMLMASEYLVRVGFIIGDYTQPDFNPNMQQPFMLEREVLAFELQAGFAYEALIGMDIIAKGELSLHRDGYAKFIVA